MANLFPGVPMLSRFITTTRQVVAPSHFFSSWELG